MSNATLSFPCTARRLYAHDGGASFLAAVRQRALERRHAREALEWAAARRRAQIEAREHRAALALKVNRIVRLNGSRVRVRSSPRSTSRSTTSARAAPPGGGSDPDPAPPPDVKLLAKLIKTNRDGGRLLAQEVIGLKQREEFHAARMRNLERELREVQAQLGPRRAAG